MQCIVAAIHLMFYSAKLASVVRSVTILEGRFWPQCFLVVFFGMGLFSVLGNGQNILSFMSNNYLGQALAWQPLKQHICLRRHSTIHRQWAAQWLLPAEPIWDGWIIDAVLSRWRCMATVLLFFFSRLESCVLSVLAICIPPTWQSRCVFRFFLFREKKH